MAGQSSTSEVGIQMANSAKPMAPRRARSRERRRGAKSQAKVSMRHELSRVEISGPEALVSAARLAQDDLRRAGKVTGDLVFTSVPDAEGISVAAELAPQD